MNKVVIYTRVECEVCGREMNPQYEEYWRGRRICVRCKEELTGKER